MPRSSSCRLRASAVLLPLLLTACIPLPVHKTLQPEASMTVRDATGAPLPGATVQLITGAFSRAPQGWERSRSTATTDATGMARFAAEYDWRVEVPGLVHGVTEYGWHWCVAHPGYRTWRTDDANVAFEPQASVTLSPAAAPGDALACEARRADAPSL
ncbi:carboxypeptidase-like regulatory domain-containing protein [Pseudomonadota bacterium AL_CKDN230030165-1A_HGKHYDSX7]